MAVAQARVFLSYSPDDSSRVRRVRDVLRAAGIAVWLDSDDDLPVSEVRAEIARAVDAGDFAYVACFSTNTETPTSHGDPHLRYVKTRAKGLPYPSIFPVRLEPCELPRTLSETDSPTVGSVTDLFGPRRDIGIARLVSGLLQVGTHPDVDAASAGGFGAVTASRAAHVPHGDSIRWVKSVLRQPAKEIELHDYVTELATTCLKRCTDPVAFPKDSPRLNDLIDGSRFIASQVDKYFDAVSPLLEVLIVAGAWGQPTQDSIWSRSVERLANLDKHESGKTALLSLRRFPPIPLLYGTGLASVYMSNYGPLRAVAVDAQSRSERAPMPYVASAHIYRPFESGGFAPDILARTAEGKDVTEEDIDQFRRGGGMRHTPVSDYLHARLRPFFQALIPDDDEYTAAFDRLEVLLGGVAIDCREQISGHGYYTSGAWFGAFTWRDRFGVPNLETRMLHEAEEQGKTWPPLQGGLFGQNPSRAVEAMSDFVNEAEGARKQRW